MSAADAIDIDDTPTRALRHPAAGMAGVAIAPADEPPAQRSPRRRLLSYELGEPIGSGGMGTVYKAVHTWLGRTVAVKFIAKEVLGDPEAVARFAHESRAIGRLDHPNIVRAMDAGCVGGTHFLVTEFVDGCDLARLVKTVGPLRISDACEIVRQAALGLQHLHEQQLVHRDVKPSNLLLSRLGMVKLLDFGLARIDSNQTALTTTGQMIGTLDFLAPEQAADARQVDIRSDIYSLGCTLYFLLTGQAPFSGPEYATPASKIKAHLADSPPSPKRGTGRIPLAVVACLDRMMAKSPAERYPAPAEVARALAAHARGADLPKLASRGADAGSISASRAAAEPMWSSMQRVAGSIPATAGWMLRQMFGRRTPFRSPAKHEPLLSVSGVVGLILIALILSRCSCISRLMPGKSRGAGGGPPPADVHYFRIGPGPAEHP
ncbi:MAG TPA: serine/threonine-protein kinase [Pirellulales bacterium]|jgi:serine/threonine protein kinase|nr:serine/threonine-protein kinase [Pirellulales bacterium]